MPSQFIDHREIDDLINKIFFYEVPEKFAMEKISSEEFEKLKAEGKIEPMDDFRHFTYEQIHEVSFDIYSGFYELLKTKFKIEDAKAGFYLCYDQ